MCVCVHSTILEEEKVQQKERARMEMRRQVTVSWDSGGSDEAPPKVSPPFSTPPRSKAPPCLVPAPSSPVLVPHPLPCLLRVGGGPVLARALVSAGCWGVLASCKEGPLVSLDTCLSGCLSDHSDLPMKTRLHCCLLKIKCLSIQCPPP